MSEAVSRGGADDEQVRPPPRSRKGEATRARLLDAAKRVFERDGFHDARVGDIADEAGLAAGSLYHYFASKDEIFRALARAEEERLVAPAEGETGLLATASGREGIRVSVERYLQRYRDHVGIIRVIEQVSRYDPEVNAVRMATIKQFDERAEQEIRRLQREGLADASVDPALAADALTAMAMRFAELWLVQGDRDYEFDTVVAQLTKLMANALGLPPEPDATKGP